MDMRFPPRVPQTFGERASLALARLFLSPVEWDGSVLPVAARLLDINLVIAAGDGGRALDCHRVKPVAKQHGCDVLATYVDPYRSGHVVHFDIALHKGGKVWLYPASRLWIAPDHRGQFAPEVEIRGPAVALRPERLVAHYNEVRRHKALGYRSPREYITQTREAPSKVVSTARSN